MLFLSFFGFMWQDPHFIGVPKSVDDLIRQGYVRTAKITTQLSFSIQCIHPIVLFINKNPFLSFINYNSFPIFSRYIRWQHTSDFVDSSFYNLCLPQLKFLEWLIPLHTIYISFNFIIFIKCNYFFIIFIMIIVRVDTNLTAFRIPSATKKSVQWSSLHDCTIFI